MLYGVLIFVGFETAANLGRGDRRAEAVDPAGRARRSVVVVSIFYVIAAYVEVAGFGFDLAVITSPAVAGAPLFALGAPGGEFGSDFWLKVLILVVFLDMLAVVRRRGGRLDARRVRDGSRPTPAGAAGVGLEPVRHADRGDRAADRRSRRC